MKSKYNNFPPIMPSNENGLEKNNTFMYIMSIHAIAVRHINATSGNELEQMLFNFDRCINYITVRNNCISSRFHVSYR